MAGGFARLLHLFWGVVIIAVLTAQLVTYARTDRPTARPGAPLDSCVVRINPMLVVLAFIAIADLTPKWKETFFRGLLFGGLRVRWGVVLATVATTALFSVVPTVLVLVPHFFTSGWGWPSILTALV
ncbi:hypothetical protein [Nesterenkonia lutea]|uniref:Membrane protease YdiL (CAAX protease family) n=1 Tax=Nesterenkonia lutea TaxID=272919 RepID=A0ABR9JBT7_9MICC|nr:hypothetical protein [Nesterenkonia lutea]MBE1523402.1 membrane protease YdiL (CAAX protease family) [Nesterenkonia lutea]